MAPDTSPSVISSTDESEEDIGNISRPPALLPPSGVHPNPVRFPTIEGVTASPGLARDAGGDRLEPGVAIGTGGVPRGDDAALCPPVCKHTNIFFISTAIGHEEGAREEGSEGEVEEATRAAKPKATTN